MKSLKVFFGAGALVLLAVLAIQVMLRVTG